MEIRDRRKTRNDFAIDQKLVQEGTQQLSNEIKVLENWLKDLEGSSDHSSESLAAKKSYDDMLRSRREMLNTLVSQSSISERKLSS